jgi:hypothetical protein
VLVPTQFQSFQRAQLTATCRRAIKLAPSEAARVLLWGSLGALLLSAGELYASVKAMDASMKLAREQGMERTEAVGRMVCG